MQLSKEGYARKIIHNGSLMQIENSVTRVTVRHHSASLVMPKYYPHDGIFNQYLTTIKESYMAGWGILFSGCPWFHHSVIPTSFQLRIDEIWPNFAYALIWTRSRLGLLRVNFRELITELWPLIDFRTWFPLNILRTNWWNLPNFAYAFILGYLGWDYYKSVFENL